MTMIAPLWGDVDITLAGDVSYRTVSIDHSIDQSILSEINEKIQQKEDYSSFTTNWALIVTWHQVGYYPNGTDKVCNMRAVI